MQNIDIQPNITHHNDTQHSDAKHNDTQHTDAQHDNQITTPSSIFMLIDVCHYAECCYSECCGTFG